MHKVNKQYYMTKQVSNALSRIYSIFNVEYLTRKKEKKSCLLCGDYTMDLAYSKCHERNEIYEPSILALQTDVNYKLDRICINCKTCSHCDDIEDCFHCICFYERLKYMEAMRKLLWISLKWILTVLFYTSIHIMKMILLSNIIFIHYSIVYYWMLAFLASKSFDWLKVWNTKR